MDGEVDRTLVGFFVVTPSDLGLCDEQVKWIIRGRIIQPSGNLLLDLLHALLLVTIHHRINRIS